MCPKVCFFNISKLCPDKDKISATAFNLLFSLLKAPFKNHFFGIKYPYPQSRALTIYDSMRPALRKGYLMPKKRFLKGALKGFLEELF